MKKNNKKGFTLVELVIVVAVMAVLVAVAIPTVGSIKKSAEDAVRDSNARTIESVIKLAEANASAAAAADGVATLDVEDVAQAVYDAKLGIDKDTYYYNATSGTVTYSASAVSGCWSIKFEKDGTAGNVKVTVSDGTTTETVNAPAAG